jgi:hypothetical protein
MTAFAKPDQIIIGQLVYNVLEDEQKSTFRLLPINPNIWDYFSNITGGIYNLYGSLNEINDYEIDSKLDPYKPEKGEHSF